MKARAKELGLRRVRINQAGCLDRCEFGPTMVIYPEGIWYRVTTRDEVEQVIQHHLVLGQRVPGLLLTEADVAGDGSGAGDGRPIAAASSCST